MKWKPYNPHQQQSNKYIYGQTIYSIPCIYIQIKKNTIKKLILVVCSCNSSTRTRKKPLQKPITLQ